MSSTVATPAPVGLALLLAGVAAVAAPTLLAYNLPPSSTQLNQLLSIGLWGFLLMSLPTAAVGGWRAAMRATSGPSAALGLLAAAVVGSWGVGSLPGGLTLSALACVGAALAALWAGASSARTDGASGDRLWAVFAWGLLAAGLAGALVGAVQVFRPAWADGEWIARSGLAGRAVGNVRQPNHLSTLLLWALIALVPLWSRRRVNTALATVLGAALVLGVVLTASRTGVVGIVLLAAWGLVDRRLAPRLRLALLAAPLLYLLGWLAMAQWAAATAHTFGGEARLAEADLSASRFGIWSNTLSLIRTQPWQGVGFGEFNLAWTLSAFPGRPTAFFDHTHNLPLHLAVELGLPLAAAVLGLLLWALWQAARRPAAEPGADAGRAAFMLVLMVGLHSLLEYPLWYSYFLLPTAFAWGYALGGASTPQRAEARGQEVPRWAAAAGAALLVGAALAVVDYTRVVAIYSPPKGAVPLAERIRAGQASVLFAHHADYAAATTDMGGDPLSPERRLAFARTTHYLLDTRLMIAWIEALAASGQAQDRDLARHLAARLREFRNPAADTFFAACEAPPPAAGAVPVQCEPEGPPLDWRLFLGRP